MRIDACKHLTKFADSPRYSGLVPLKSVLHPHVGMRYKADNPVPSYIKVVYCSIAPIQE